jgi:Meiotically up-regulated gene 113
MSKNSKTLVKRRGRDEIVDLYRACTIKNENKPPHKKLFTEMCGVTEADVRRHFWRDGYTELAREAGVQPNLRNSRLDDNKVFEEYAKICLYIQKIPNSIQLAGAQRELGTKTHSVDRRFKGGLDEFQGRFRGWLENCPPNLKAILEFDGWRKEESAQSGVSDSSANIKEGYVYMGLLKLGSEKRYKIGKSVFVERRNAEISLQLPENLQLIHAIRTDDAYGIEDYWHKRFAAKNTKGEWFVLSLGDIRAFKKRKFM